jgi:hypothetical protein
VSKYKPNKKQAELFDPEDGGTPFHRNPRELDYTASHPDI